jgi:ribokinase
MNNRGRIFVVGSANMDMVLRVPRFPHAGETLAGSDLDLFPGGKGANQACAAARLGGDVCFVGCVGSDIFGTQLLESLREAGVDISRVRRLSRATGCASIYVAPNGQNSIVISPGANAGVTFEHVADALGDLNSSDFVLLQLEIPFETVRLSLEKAKSVGATSIFDPAPARKLDRGVLQLVSLLTPNQTEAGILLDRENVEHKQEDCDLIRLASETLKLGPASVIFKLGEAGCAICSEGAATRVGAYTVKAVDTTGAGDVFNGALAVALAEGRSMPAAARFANAAAALSVTRPGAQASIPSRDEVDKFVETNPAAEVRDLLAVRG